MNKKNTEVMEAEAAGQEAVGAAEETAEKKTVLLLPLDPSGERQKGPFEINGRPFTVTCGEPCEVTQQQYDYVMNEVMPQRQRAIRTALAMQDTSED